MRIGRARDGKARQHGITVLAALVMEIVAENAGHARKRSQFCRQITPRSARHSFVHFLQGDDVRLLAFDHV